MFVFGFRYYNVFIDDFSRSTSTYLMKDRTHVLDIIKQVFIEIKNQFSTSVKVLRTDNALEFMKKELSIFFFSIFNASNGIIHETSYAHPSQQNGVAKSKHRHILDVTCH